jgi:hypothetical protein
MAIRVSSFSTVSRSIEYVFGLFVVCENYTRDIIAILSH